MSFDFTNDKLSGGVLEPGKYTLSVAKAEMVTSSKGNEMIKVEFHVKGGGRVWDNFVMSNDIARSRLKSLIVAANGPLKFQSVSELEGLTCEATLKVKSDEYGEKNVISSFQKVKDAPAANPFS